MLLRRISLVFLHFFFYSILFYSIFVFYFIFFLILLFIYLFIYFYVVYPIKSQFCCDEDACNRGFEKRPLDRLPQVTRASWPLAKKTPRGTCRGGWPTTNSLRPCALDNSGSWFWTIISSAGPRRKRNSTRSWGPLLERACTRRQSSRPRNDTRCGRIRLAFLAS